MDTKKDEFVVVWNSAKYDEFNKAAIAATTKPGKLRLVRVYFGGIVHPAVTNGVWARIYRRGFWGPSMTGLREIGPLTEGQIRREGIELERIPMELP